MPAMNAWRRPAQTLLTAMALLLVISPAVWGAPAISQLSQRGLTVGKPTLIVVDGADLAPDLRLLSTAEAPIAAQVVRPGATATRVELEVTLSPQCQVGFLPFRFATSTGVSAPIELAVDHLATVPFGPKVESLPIALQGVCSGPQVLKTQFQGAKGSRVVLDAQAVRLGSALRPVVRIYSTRGTQLAWSAPKMSLGGDARLVVTLPADGLYSVEVHDQLFRAGNPAFFRLTIGDLQFADQVYPLAVQGAQPAVVQSFGSQVLALNFAGDASGLPGERMLQPDASLATKWTGSAPRVLVTGIVETKEPDAQASAAADVPAVPVGVSGTLAKPGEEDKYLLPVTAGQNLRFEVTSQRAGSGLDPVLMIRNEQGAQLAANDDRPGTADPGLDFTVPAGVSKLQVAIKDMEGRGSPSGFYRIEVIDLATPSFVVTASEAQLNLPLGGTQLVTYSVARNNYAGPITLSFPGLPGEVRVAGNVIPANASQAIVSFTAPAQGLAPALLTMVAMGEGTPSPLVRFATHAAPSKLAATRRSFGFATSTATPAQLAWQLPAGAQLVQGAKLATTVKIARAAGVTGSVRFKLVTSQPMPKKTVKVNNADQQQDDLDRAVRLEGAPMLAADQAEMPVTVLVPADLPLMGWDLALVGEILSADGKNVVATVTSESMRLVAAAPLTLQLTSAPMVEAKAGLGETGKLAGKVTRLPGLAGPVVLTLEGLPKPHSAPRFVVAADKEAFEFPVAFMYGVAPGDLAGVSIVAKLEDPALGTLRSGAIPVQVKVVAGEKPPVEQPLVIFEDDAAFVGLLNEGDATASLDTNLKRVGSAALRVTPGQKLSSKLPMLGVKIKENPGPGEFRYIRFLWHKRGGNQICLQLNHDGIWGPSPSGIKFRYHAGPGPEPFNGSVSVNDATPGDFVVVIRDLYADFGEFTLNGLAFTPIDGEAGLFDSIYLGRGAADFESIGQPK